MPAPSAVREAIGKQRTVPHSVAAMLRAVTSQIYAAADTGDLGAVVALADDISANGPAWVGAITQNTPAAEAVDAMAMDHTLVPTGLGEVFVSPGVRVAPAAPLSKAEQAAADKAQAQQDKEEARAGR